MNEPHPNNDWYQELCALAAIGEASPSEFDELQQHMAECDDCRQLYADFCRMTANDLAAVAVLRGSEGPDATLDAAFDEQEALSRLLVLAGRERSRWPSGNPPQPFPAPQRRDLSTRWAGFVVWLRRPVLSYGSLALLLAAGAGFGAYRFKGSETAPAIARLNARLRESETHTRVWEARAHSAEAQRLAAFASLREAQAERDRLQKSLLTAQAQYAGLDARRQALESQVAAERASAKEQVTQLGQQLQAVRSANDYDGQQIAALELRARNAAGQAQREMSIAQNLETRLELAQQSVSKLQSEIPSAQGFKPTDADELFGARDLHIVDVYDVGSNGQTKRTYGRVYYVANKLLIFYAFDLQDKERHRKAVGFQAWGYKEASEAKPEDLGLFHLDTHSANRWVLQVNNPRVLERIDAVYVTLEPRGGSPVPRGRRLLYADLASPPNHP